MSMAKVKKFLTGAAKPAVIDVLRGYLARRIRAVQVDDIIKAIESDDTELFSKLSEKDKRIFELIARRFGEYSDLLTVKNVMMWLIEDVPFHAGVIYGHPRGLDWLKKLLEQIRIQASAYTAETAKVAELELVPAESS